MKHDYPTSPKGSPKSLFSREVLCWVCRRNLPFVVVLVDVVLLFSSLAIGLGSLCGIAALADMGILDGEKLKLCLSFICPMVTMTGYASPIPLVLDALRKRDVQYLPTPVFKSQSACNILALAYAIRIQNKVVLASNLFGLACQILYLSVCYFVSLGNRKWIYFAGLYAVAYSTALYVSTEVISIALLGQVTTVVSIVLFVSPLAKLGIILKTKNATSLPTAMTVISTLNNGVWTLYGLLIKDSIVTIPSILGFLLCFFQVLVLLWCSNVLPFDLSFLLLPCKTTSSAKVAFDKELGLAENFEDLDFEDVNPEVTPRVLGNIADSDI